MIFIASANPTARLNYICEVIFSRVLNTPHQLIAIDEIQKWVAKYPAASLIYYSAENNFGPGSIVIPDEGLLSEENISKKEVKINVNEGSFITISFSENDYSGFSFGFDVFSSSFYLLTEYEKYTEMHFDNHGRYDENKYELYKNHYHCLPLIHIYAEALWKILLKRNPILQRRHNIPDYQITFDIDSPYLYRGKPLWVNMGRMVKELLTLQFQGIGDRMATLLAGTKDPYDVYDYIFEKTNHKKLIFFWLIDRNSSKDTWHTFKNKLYRDLIKKIAQKQIPQGIHPSYTAFCDKMRIIHEKQQLELILGKIVTKARMHYLKYRLPQTYQYLIEAGIKEDYTACTFEKPGFKNFIAVPFPWFDLEKNAVTDLIIHPTMVMDRTVQKYMNTSTEESFAVIRDYIDITFRYNGRFTLLLHNNTLSDKVDWKGWRPVFEKTMQYLQERKAE